MLFILVCLGGCHRILAAAGYASPMRRFVVLALSGFYLAGIGWWAGSRIAAAWRRRDRDEDQLG